MATCPPHLCPSQDQVPAAAWTMPLLGLMLCRTAARLGACPAPCASHGLSLSALQGPLPGVSPSKRCQAQLLLLPQHGLLWVVGCPCSGLGSPGWAPGAVFPSAMRRPEADLAQSWCWGDCGEGVSQGPGRAWNPARTLSPGCYPRKASFQHLLPDEHPAASSPPPQRR